MRNLVVNETWPSFTSTPSQTGSICSDAACLQLQEVMFLFGSGRSDHEMICHDLSYLSLLQPHLPRLPWCFVRKLDKGVLHLVGRAMAGGAMGPMAEFMTGSSSCDWAILTIHSTVHTMNIKSSVHRSISQLLSLPQTCSNGQLLPVSICFFCKRRVSLNLNPIVYHHFPMKLVRSIDHQYLRPDGGDSARQVPNLDMITAQRERTPARHRCCFRLVLLDFSLENTRKAWEKLWKWGFWR